jgi:carboxymethylenebutenolidase
MTGTRVEIPSVEGAIEAHVFHPQGTGPWPAVIFFQDGLGVRPALHQMAERLASNGYYVLLPNMFWRSGAFAPFDAKSVFMPGNPERDRLMKLIGGLTPELSMQDTGAFLKFLSAQPQVAHPEQLACTGYCMGGGLSLLAACTFPDRIAAAASFHGARFVTSPEAPAELQKKARARLYLGVAEKDAAHTPEVTARLTAALDERNLPYAIELYEGVAHGWAVSDTPVFDAAAAERHWDRLLTLLRETFQSSQRTR